MIHDILQFLFGDYQLAIAPFILPLAYSALTAIPSIYGLSKAAQQKKQADELARIKNPNYQIPDAAQEALRIAKYNALKTQIPGYNAISGKIGASTANQIRNINELSPNNAIAAGSAAVGQQQDAYVNLGIAGEQMYSQNQDKLTNQLGNMSGWQEKQQQWNVLDPYLRAKQTESALRNASNENTMSGLKGLTGAISGGLMLANQNGVFGGENKSPSVLSKTPTTWNPSPIFPDASSQPMTAGQTMLSPELIQIGLKKLRASNPMYANMSDEQLIPMLRN